MGPEYPSEYFPLRTRISEPLHEISGLRRRLSPEYRLLGKHASTVTNRPKHAPRLISAPDGPAVTPQAS